MSTTCYCGSELGFEKCCGAILASQRQAETALALMKSRYSAYCVAASDYLMDTTHPSQRVHFDKASIEQWAKESKWKGLKIISTHKGTSEDTRGEVVFQAFFRDEAQKNRFHYEHSFFVKEKNQWFYLSGKLLTPNRNESCPCGSGKRYKKCCEA